MAHHAASQRAAVLDRVVANLASRIDELTELGTIENGAPLRLSQALTVGFPLMHIQHFADLARKYDWERPGPVTGQVLHTGFVRREPIGVCVGIVPWNFPLVIAVWKAIPALAAGNSVVLKTDEKTPIGALELAKILRQAGLPDGAYNVVTGDGETVGAHLVAHPDVRKVSFTGSTAVGRSVMRASSDTIKRVTLELGGKGPSIVLDDADLETAVDGSIYGFLLHAGQACESGTRLLVPNDLHDIFIERLIARLGTLKIGNPLDPGTDIGPVMSAQQRDRILGYVERGKAEGATLVHGGGVPAGAGLREGLLGRTDRVHRCHQRHVHCPRGDLRAGAVGHPVRVGRRGDQDRERHRVRVVRRGVEPGYPACARGGEPAAGGVGLDQRLAQHLAVHAVRRLQAKQRRPRTGAGCTR